MNTTCTICGKTFTARHTYGLCPSCTSSDRLREFDRVESASRLARRHGISPVTLTLVDWLATLSDYHGLCALCKRYTANRILMFDPSQGLTYTNVIPCCGACEYHYIHGFDTAIETVKEYLTVQTLPRFIIPNPNEEELQTHAEYQ
jgi:hypothetical protein